jgi:tRNA (guanine10-N2)-dimethyltransferase
MRYFLELSKEFRHLPASEIIACLQTEGISFNILSSTQDCFVFETDRPIAAVQQMADRLAFSFVLNKLMFISSVEMNSLREIAEHHLIHEEGAIAVRCRNRSATLDSQKIIEELATVYTKGRTVSLQNPDIQIRALLTNDHVYVGQLILTVKREQFEKRSAQYRPFFSPISLHPMIARALVNLSKIKRKQLLFDPFCGTGGILIEAGLIGAMVIGSDVSEKMVEGTKENLSFYSIKPEKIFTADIDDCSKFIEGSVDAVVTDLPYGKATTTMGESLEELYTRAFNSIHSILKKDGRAVLGLPSSTLIENVKDLFIVKDLIEIPVHRSLTRYFAVLEKRP